MTMYRIAMAYEMACMAHAGQRRQGNNEPYVNHPIRVAHMVSQAAVFGEFNDVAEVVIAAVLHDVIEDSQVTSRDIEIQFGHHVGFLVDGCTDDLEIANLPRLERKTIQAEKLVDADPSIQLIKLADQVDNLESLFKTLDNRVIKDVKSRVECMNMVVDVCGRADSNLLMRAEQASKNILDVLDVSKKANGRVILKREEDSHQSPAGP